MPDWGVDQADERLEAKGIVQQSVKEVVEDLFSDGLIQFDKM